MEASLKLYFAKYLTNLISILTLAGVLLFGYAYYQNREKEKADRQALEDRYAKLDNTREEYAQITAQMAQLATLYKDQAELSKSVAILWKDLAIERGERVKLTTDTKATVDTKTETQPKSDFTYTTPDGTGDYVLNELRINGKDSPPIGYVEVKKDGSVEKKNYKFELHVESVQLKDDLTGKIRVVSKAYLVPLENGLADNSKSGLKKWAGDKYPLQVSGGETVVDPQEPLIPMIKDKGFVPWSLNLNGGFGVFGGKNGSVDTKATVDVALAGYGYSKRDLDWKFVQVGADYSKDGGLGLHLTPFSYRPFPSVLANSYIGPGVFISPDTTGYFVGLNIGF